MTAPSGSQKDSEAQAAAPWWSGGLRFECLGCGRCCRGEPGGVFLLPSEERRAAERLKITPEEFRRRYETSRWRFPSIKETEKGRCIMNGDDNRCAIYPCRPIACRTWPFWPELLSAPDAWERAAAQCPGMNSGPLWEPWKIEALLKAHREYMDKLSTVCRKEAD